MNNGGQRPLDAANKRPLKAKRPDKQPGYKTGQNFFQPNGERNDQKKRQ